MAAQQSRVPLEPDASALEDLDDFLTEIPDEPTVPRSGRYRAREERIMRGPSLADVLRARGALGVAEAVDLLLGVCETVAAGHAMQLTYRGIGTHSLFLESAPDRPAYLHLVDHGASRASQHQGLHRTPAVALDGLAYLAPEQVDGSDAVDHRADIWALGAVLYEMLCGRRAFDGPSTRAVLARIANDDPTPLGARRREIPTALALAVHACLQKAPWQRPHSVEDAATMFRPFATSRRSAVRLAGPVSAAPTTLIGYRSPDVVERRERPAPPPRPRESAPPPPPSGRRRPPPPPRAHAPQLEREQRLHDVPRSRNTERLHGISRPLLDAEPPYPSQVRVFPEHPRPKTLRPLLPPSQSPPSAYGEEPELHLPASAADSTRALARRQAWLLFGSGLVASVAASAIAATVLRGWDPSDDRSATPAVVPSSSLSMLSGER